MCLCACVSVHLCAHACVSVCVCVCVHVCVGVRASVCVYGTSEMTSALSLRGGDRHQPVPPWRAVPESPPPPFSRPSPPSVTMGDPRRSVNHPSGLSLPPSPSTSFLGSREETHLRFCQSEVTFLRGTRWKVTVTPGALRSWALLAWPAVAAGRARGGRGRSAPGAALPSPAADRTPPRLLALTSCCRSRVAHSEFPGRRHQAP